jgi:hypothetical protein
MNDPKTSTAKVKHSNLIRSRNALWLAAMLFLFVAPLVRSQSAGSSSQDSFVLEPSLRTMLGPSRTVAQYHYVMTGRVRLLLFWRGADDVGGGYIRRTVSLSNPDVRFIQVLFGSDPAKAPRRINHWGAATEAIDGQSSAFFGFMKSANDASAEDAQADIQHQSQRGTYAFSAIVSFVDKSRALSRTAPLFSEVDFNLHQVEQAQQLVIGHLTDNRPVRRLDAPERRCAEARGFLHAVDELITHVLTVRPVPSSRCYVHNSRNYTVTLERSTRVASKRVHVERKNGTMLEATYLNLIRAEFSVVNDKSEWSTFELLLGRDSELRGVPVQIVYQPNWWFQVVLNLDDAANPGRLAAGSARR